MEIEISSSDDEEEENGTTQTSSTTDISPSILSLSLFLLTWQASFRVSDTCVAALLGFLYHFLMFVSTITCSHQLGQFAVNIPRNVKKLREVVGLNVDGFTQFIVCPQCHSIYDSDSCIVTTGTRKEAKTCQHIAFPDHPHASFRRRCNQPLMKSIKAKTSCIFRPFKVYCYQGIMSTLKVMLARPNFIANCEHWRRRDVPNGVLGDIYDGRVWKEFQVVNGKPFLNDPYSIAFSLNVDWFQPFKHVTDSVGAIYLSILNLPRDLRYKAENIILCGIIPGPKEPKRDLNSYLYPLIQELLILWEGVTVNINSCGEKKIRAALICVTSDLPATRKLCGFASHAASMGCSKCLKRFPSMGDKLDYSGFQRSEWTPRDLESHRSVSHRYRQANTRAQQSAILKEHGVRYSILLLLTYFDILRFHVVDAMHNLLLGTAKNITRIWCETGVLSRTDFETIQTTVNSINVPVDVGRIPSKIASMKLFRFYG